MKMKFITAVAAAVLLNGGVGLADGTCCSAAGGEQACMAKPQAAEATAAATKPEATLSTAALAALVNAHTPVTILDARTGKFDDGRRIVGAAALSPDAAEQDVATAIPDKSRLVVTYCAGLKCPASHKLAERLRQLGYRNVIEFPEGIAGWAEAGNPVNEPAK